MSSYYIWTVGCQVNVADSGKLAAGLRRLGWEPTDAADHADFIILNTCAVRQQAEDKAANKLESIKFLREANPDLRVAVMGCTVGPRSEDLQARFPFVDVFAQPQQFDEVISVLDLPDEDTGGEFWPSVYSDDSADSAFAYVPVVEGCDKFCTYCIVPLRRGRERSRPIAEVRREVEAHVARGVREITLLGQTVEAYGKDQPAVAAGTAHADLFDLMTTVHEVEGLERIRQLTSYPPDMTDRILEGMAALPKVCESFSLPVQAGDDATLAAMRRAYTVSEFVNRVEKIRNLMPEVGISTDVIVGFPGETAAQFQNTL
ncbi:MAG TPA: MiaB/RimO family radical SAM methylthiotransferase, partial [Dehalococcoidia bacterium]|nr:MiaB/RimO family radical SAM methylthiotransferase [Dehalococcoidia bacterium]